MSYLKVKWNRSLPDEPMLLRSALGLMLLGERLARMQSLGYGDRLDHTLILKPRTSGRRPTIVIVRESGRSGIPRTIR
jgi:hypothetical protein